MAIAPKIEIKQSQSLLMTPQLRQAINLLQMSNLELNELIEKELETNPLLEREDDKLESISNDKESDYKPQEETGDTDLNPEYDSQFNDYGSDREGYEDSPDYSWEDYSNSKTNSSGEDFDYFEKKLKDEKSLYVLIDEQISLNFETPKEKLIAKHLTEFLDEAGYFRGDIKAVAQKLNTPLSELTKILNKLKEFEPSGIFAENLSECLKIQLKDLNRLDPMIEKLLNSLELLADKKFKELKKVLICGDEDLMDMIKDIKSLNPKPAADYLNDITGYVIPDVFLKTNKHGDFFLELNNMSLPKVLINKQYFSEIKNSSKKNKEAKRYMKEQLNSASFLVKALHQRAVTILKTSEEIVKQQRAFFEKGVEHLKPMLLRDVAENIEMHESTISRVTTNKYIHTPRGLFELKYFFSAKAGSYTGDENTSITSIKHKIKKLIEEEKTNNILSDDKLVEEMAKLGFKIARRTIAKYRESMNIPTSAERKREKRSK